MAVEELKALICEQAKKNFSTKGTSFEVKPNIRININDVITN